MDRREFIKKSLAGIAIASSIGSIPLISACGHNPFSSVRDSEQNLESYLNSNSIIEDNNIKYYIQTDKKIYNLGEKVEILYKVTNLGKEELVLRTYQSPEFNILIKKDGGTIWAIYHGWWTWSPGIKISAGETLDNPLNYSKRMSDPPKWDMRYDESDEANQGKLVGPGIYNVIFVTYNFPTEAEVGVPITIR